MNLNAWHLPWGEETVPHALLDIIRGCNITCNACYNTRAESVKTVSEIELELTTLLSMRRLSSISLIGGEVLLHPALCDIVRLVKSHGLCVQMFTNGVLLDDGRLSQLKAAGLDMVFIHIDGGQTRPDLAPNPSRDQLRQLWEERTLLVARHGIDVGLTMTAFEERLSDVIDMVTYALDSTHVNYLLVTLFRDMDNLAAVHGDLRRGLSGRLIDPEWQRTDNLTNARMARCLDDALKLKPFAFLGSNRRADDPRWLSYLVVSGCKRVTEPLWHSLKASGCEKAFLALTRRATGKYPMYRRQNTFQLMMQLLINGLTGGDFVGNMRFMLKCGWRGGRPGIKRLLFQCPAEVGRDGSVTHCLNCPDAVLRNGKLVPVCIGDRAV